MSISLRRLPLELLSFALLLLPACDDQPSPPDISADEDPLLCPAGLTLCGTQCVALELDPQHCGDCARQCAETESCVAGECVQLCPPGQELCGSLCVELSSNPEHCGVCFASCEQGQQCIDSACACPEPSLLCEQRCIDPSKDREHCGASGDCSAEQAGYACQSGELCAQGVCVSNCPDAMLACDGACVFPDRDELFCGASGDCKDEQAGQVCASGERCIAGVCQLDCAEGQIACEQRCVDPLSDRDYCGAHAPGCLDAKRCAAGEVCVSGVCQLNCPSGFARCNDQCVDGRWSSQSCGAQDDCEGENAGERCAPGEVCDDGECAASCQLGMLECDESCINPNTDRSHCGASGDCNGANAGAVCGPGEICSAGSCQLSCQLGLVQCGDRCIDPAHDRDHCGATAPCTGLAAGERCEQGRVCSAGVCTLECQANEVRCNQRCVEPLSDRIFCGARALCIGSDAGSSCDAGEICENGSCQPSCGPPMLRCAEQCVDPRFDPEHCGACDAPCAVNETCVQGSCKSFCPPAKDQALAGALSRYGFCWYLSGGGESCDSACAAVGGQNLANRALGLWDDNCSSPDEDDLATSFYEAGNPGAWNANVGTTPIRTLGYGYEGGARFGKCESGTGGYGTFPGESNASPIRNLVCPCFEVFY